jgi:hypothetical protein
MSTLGASTVSRSRLTIPFYGTAFADVVPETGGPPAVGAKLTLTLAGLAAAMTVTRSGTDSPDSPHVTLVSGAGWDKPLRARSYQADGGVKLSTILRDLATDTGEQFAALPPDRVVGTAYFRPANSIAAPSTGRMALSALWRRGLVPPWWVDGPGLTRFDARPSGAATGRADVMRRDASVGLRVVGVDAPAGFLPGTSIEGVITRRLVVREAAHGLTLEAWSL